MLEVATGYKTCTDTAQPTDGEEGWVVGYLKLMIISGLIYRWVCGYFQSSYGYELLGVTRGQYTAEVLIIISVIN